MYILSDSCDWCGASGEKLNVDHDHDTDAIRGTLCNRCNTAEPSVRRLGWCQVLGYFERDLGSYRAYRSAYNKRAARLSNVPYRKTDIDGQGLYRQDPTYWAARGVTVETQREKRNARRRERRALLRVTNAR